MSWIIENWIMVGVGVVILVGIFFLLRYVNSLKSGGTTREEAVRKLINLLEGVVYEITGQELSRSDCKKVAVGMLAIMSLKDISLQQLISDPDLFKKTLIESLTALAEAGELNFA